MAEILYPRQEPETPLSCDHIKNDMLFADKVLEYSSNALDEDNSDQQIPDCEEDVLACVSRLFIVDVPRNSSISNDDDDVDDLVLTDVKCLFYTSGIMAANPIESDIEATMCSMDAMAEDVADMEDTDIKSGKVYSNIPPVDNNIGALDDDEHSAMASDASPPSSSDCLAQHDDDADHQLAVDLLNEEGAASLKSLGWTCPACTFLNEDPNRPGCVMCTAERPDDDCEAGTSLYPVTQNSATIDATTLLSLGWACRACTFLNDLDRPGCAICSSDRPEDIHSNNPPLYSKLLSLQDEVSVVRANVQIECPICFAEIPSGEGVILNDCLHTFCAECLVQTIQHSGHADVKCPYTNNEYSCASSLLESEIRALLSDTQYEQYLADSLSEAEGRSENAFHCKTPDCRGWCLYEDYRVTQFECPLCGVTNCLPCKVIHAGQTCVEYNNSIIDEREKILLDQMISKGDIMKCPACKTLITKDIGCDWLLCTMCQVQICWVTRGLRWGPRGVGDISAGCRCMINGQRCHPNCQNCH